MMTINTANTNGGVSILTTFIEDGMDKMKCDLTVTQSKLHTQSRPLNLLRQMDLIRAP
jgi:hypothetical protein